MAWRKIRTKGGPTRGRMSPSKAYNKRKSIWDEDDDFDDDDDHDDMFEWIGAENDDDDDFDDDGLDAEDMIRALASLLSEGSIGHAKLPNVAGVRSRAVTIRTGARKNKNTRGDVSVQQVPHELSTRIFNAVNEAITHDRRRCGGDVRCCSQYWMAIHELERHSSAVLTRCMIEHLTSSGEKNIIEVFPILDDLPLLPFLYEQVATMVASPSNVRRRPILIALLRCLSLSNYPRDTSASTKQADAVTLMKRYKIKPQEVNTFLDRAKLHEMCIPSVPEWIQSSLNEAKASHRSNPRSKEPVRQASRVRNPGTDYLGEGHQAPREAPRGAPTESGLAMRGSLDGTNEFGKKTPPETIFKQADMQVLYERSFNDLERDPSVSAWFESISAKWQACKSFAPTCKICPAYITRGPKIVAAAYYHLTRELPPAWRWTQLEALLTLVLPKHYKANQCFLDQIGRVISAFCYFLAEDLQLKDLKSFPGMVQSIWQKISDAK
ncbi:MAG: hypothetical protein JW839_17990 [Candidatus Lokiarchaeota archaeon]|nr:hypothetical protein [Candidatus Lokiarchaeota archaeon]